MPSQQFKPPLRLSHRGNWYILITDFAETRGIRASWVWKYSSIKSNTPFEAYISSPPVVYTSGQRDVDILAWWATVGDPRLRQFAYDLLSIPAMSAEVERLFSSSKLSLAPQRRRMTDKMLEMLELLRYWYRNECIIYESDKLRER